MIMRKYGMIDAMRKPLVTCGLGIARASETGY